MQRSRSASVHALRLWRRPCRCTTHLKNGSKFTGGVAGRFKMLTYYHVCCASSPPRALPLTLIHIFETACRTRQERLSDLTSKRDTPDNWFKTEHIFENPRKISFDFRRQYKGGQRLDTKRENAECTSFFFGFSLSCVKSASETSNTIVLGTR